MYKENLSLIYCYLFFFLWSCTQTTLQSTRVNLQPIVWHQFKVAAVNQYGASSYSVPSKFIFTNPKRPGPPRGFKVTAMYKVKGHVNVDVSWKKPDSAIGKML